MLGRWLGIAILMTGLNAVLADDDPAPQEKDTVALVDSAGKEHKLTGVKLTTGTYRLAFLADSKGTTDEARKGPLALEVREPNSTTFQKGVVTLIPMTSVASVKYDYAKLTMTVAVKGARHVASHNGRDYYFCGAGCRERFLAAPEKYGAQARV